MADLILHNYPMSPFSEKIRAMLGYTGLDWQSVTVREMAPRPKLEALTGGYRKIPVAQDGADIHCDTREIAREIAARAERPELALEHNSDAVQTFVREADLELFLACVIGASGPGMLAKLAKETSVTNALRFLWDRASIGRTAKVSAMSPKQARTRIEQHLERLEDMLERDFLFGEKPCVADFSAYHGLWYVRELAERAVIRDYPKVNGWMDRIQAFGHGTRRDLSEEGALEQARQAEPKEIDAPGEDPLLGRMVSVAPDDYARDPVTGTLVAASEHKLILSRESGDLGRLHVHFPKAGFQLRQA
ncbi:glutathione S-transferase family protein [Halomonadaceae bacterium KBTZ08]